MADPHPDITRQDADAGSNGGTRPRTPRWQKIVGIVGLVLLLLFGARMLFGGGLGGGGFDHGPATDTPPPGSAEDSDEGGHNPFGGWDH
jgi:hypothetical protein